MRKFIVLILNVLLVSSSYGQVVDTLRYDIDEVVVSSIYHSPVESGGVVKHADIAKHNYGQDPSGIFKKMPSIIALNDNGTEIGYGYFRIRGLDQTRVNVTIDGCPWNEAEDFGSYFANSPDLMSSMGNIKVERGASSLYNGIAGSAGGILLESIGLYDKNDSYATVSGGSFNTYKASLVYNMPECNGWGLHIKLTTQETDGYRENSFNNSKAATVKFGYKFNNRHQIDFLTMNGYHRNGQGWIGNTLDELEVNPKANGITSSEDDNWFMTMNRIQYKGWITNNIVLTSSIYGQYQTGSYRFDLDNYMRKMVASDWGTTNALYDYGLSHSMFGNNTVAKFTINDITITTGLNAYTYNRRHYLGDKSINVGTDENYDNNGQKTDVSFLCVLNYTLFKKMVLSCNAQYRFVDFNYRDNLLDSKFKLAQWHFGNFGMNIDYNFNRHCKLYVRYNRINREPTRSDMFGGNEYYSGELATITPEICNDIEFGIEEKRGDNFIFSLNAFAMLFENELVLNGDFGTNGIPCHENAKSSYRCGLEIVIDWRIYKGLRFLANSSASQNRIETKLFGNKNHILTPNYTGNVDLMYEAKKWMIGANFNAHDKMYVDMENKYTVPWQYTLNLYGSVKISKFEVSIFLNNLTNRVNYNTGMVGANGLLYIRNAGFNFNVGLKYYL